MSRGWVCSVLLALIGIHVLLSAYLFFYQTDIYFVYNNTFHVLLVELSDNL